MGDMGGFVPINTHQLRSHGDAPFSFPGDGLPETEHIAVDLAGRLAATWVVDLLESKNRTSGTESLICVDATTKLPGAHKLRIVVSQTTVQLHAHKGGVVSTFCERCNQHLVIRILVPHTFCNKRLDPMHHLLPSMMNANEESSASKWYPLQAQFAYRCSMSTCSFRVIVDVSAPRLPPLHEPILLDLERMKTRLHQLIEEDSERYSEYATPERMQKTYPAFYLLIYINDVIVPKTTASTDETKPARARISFRNKLFTLCFGEDFSSLFDYLEFEKSVDGSEEYLKPPVLEPKETDLVPYDSRRAFFENVRMQLDLMCEKMTCSGPKLPAALLHPPGTTQDALITLMGAHYTKTSCDVLETYDREDFTFLGALRDMHESLLMYACYCQGQTWPSRRQQAYEALERVTNGRQSNHADLRKYLESEQIALATIKSMEPVVELTPIEQAYRHFNIVPDQYTTDELILQTYRVHVQQSPSAFASHKQSLLRLAEARDSSILESMAYFFTAEDADRYLEIRQDTDMDFLASTIQWLPDQMVNPKLTANALLAAARARNDHPGLIAAANEIDPSLAQAQGPLKVVPTNDPDKPVGLVNIRNTCYLNSILQYFNTITPVRNIVLNWEQYKLDTTEADFGSRRIAGSGSSLDRGEVFLAQKFIEEMTWLFGELQNPTEALVQPRQRTVLAALRTADQLELRGAAAIAAKAEATQQDTNSSIVVSTKPPPLPSRPPHVPDAPAAEGQAEFQLSQSSVMEIDEADSMQSSGTLVHSSEAEPETSYVSVASPHEAESSDKVQHATKIKTREVIESDDEEDSGAKDASMTGVESTTEAPAEVPEAVEPTVEDKITEALNDTSIKGTDQQDVEEVMGNILDHLQAAIKPTGIDPVTKMQTDVITETFYWESVLNLRTLNTSGQPTAPYRKLPDMSRWITAFPGEKGKIDLYEALDGNFDQEFLAGDKEGECKEQFSSITKAPPILHVYIQRAARRADGSLMRNDNVVQIPETLYLDRYMDSAVDSELFKRRERSWNLKRRIQYATAAPLPPPPPPQPQNLPPNVSSTLEPGYDMLDDFLEESEKVANRDVFEGFEVSEEEIAKYVQAYQIPAKSQTKASEVDIDMDSAQKVDPAATAAILDEIEAGDATYRSELAGLFSDMTQYGYRLHAIICHQGSGIGSGHYWVWIFDFEQKVWRQYNDEKVSQWDSIDSVLNAGKEPYYVAYVREDKVDELVKIPRRRGVEGREAGAEVQCVVAGGGGDEAMTGAEDVGMKDEREEEKKKQEDLPSYSESQSQAEGQGENMEGVLAAEKNDTVVSVGGTDTNSVARKETDGNGVEDVEME